MDMTSKMASRLLTALVYAQIALCFAGAASVLMRDRADAPQMATEGTQQQAGAAVSL
jgi:hypothetical protein